MHSGLKEYKLFEYSNCYSQTSPLRPVDSLWWRVQMWKWRVVSRAAEIFGHFFSFLFFLVPTVFPKLRDLISGARPANNLWWRRSLPNQSQEFNIDFKWTHKRERTRRSETKAKIIKTNDTITDRWSFYEQYRLINEQSEPTIHRSEICPIYLIVFLMDIQGVLIKLPETKAL